MARRKKRKATAWNRNAWQYGVLGIVALVFGWVIYKLWTYNTTRDDQRATERKKMDEERAGWVLEREKIRSEYEAKHRELADKYGEQLIEQIKAFRENDTIARRETADTLEAMAEASEKQADKQVAMFEKLTDRIVVANKPRGAY